MALGCLSLTPTLCLAAQTRTCSHLGSCLTRSAVAPMRHYLFLPVQPSSLSTPPKTRSCVLTPYSRKITLFPPERKERRTRMKPITPFCSTSSIALDETSSVGNQNAFTRTCPRDWKSPRHCSTWGPCGTGAGCKGKGVWKMDWASLSWGEPSCSISRDCTGIRVCSYIPGGLSTRRDC